MHRQISALYALGLLGIGAAAMFAPRPMATVFGVPTDDPAALAYVRAAGARDAVLGAIVITQLHDDVARPRTMRLASLIGLLDAVVAGATRGIRPSLAAHVGGFIVALVTGLTDRP